MSQTSKNTDSNENIRRVARVIATRALTTLRRVKTAIQTRTMRDAMTRRATITAKRV